MNHKVREAPPTQQSSIVTPSRRQVLSPPPSPCYRIPKSLQKVFVESNQGLEIHEPPQDRVANKVFDGHKKRYFGNNFFHSPVKACKNFLSNASNVRSMPLVKDEGKSPQKVKTTKQGTEVNRTEKKSKRLSSSPVKKSKSCPTLSPQDYLDAMLHSRGYSTTRYKSLDTGYYYKPTPLQIASYGIRTEKSVRCGDYESMKKFIQCGLSSNPSNKFGASVAHMSCRLNDATMLRTLIENGCDIQCADNMGRTPLHEACWNHSPCFELIETILEIDIHMLFLVDSRDSVPLQYAPRESWSHWLQFLASKKDVYWPKHDTSTSRKKTIMDKKYIPSLVPPLVSQRPNTRAPKDPVNALPLKIVTLVAEGRLEPAEAVSFIVEYEDEDSFYDDDDDDSVESTSMDDDDDEFDDIFLPISSLKKLNEKESSIHIAQNLTSHSKSDASESDCSFSERELTELLENIGRRRSEGVAWSKNWSNRTKKIAY